MSNAFIRGGLAIVMGILVSLIVLACPSLPSKKDGSKPGAAVKDLSSPKVAKATRKFSSFAFLDKSLHIVESARFYTYSGDVINSATFFPDSESVLLLISPSASEPDVIRPGKLVAISLKEPYDAYQLKEAKQVFALAAAKDYSSAYFSSIEKLEEEKGSDGLGQESLGQKDKKKDEEKEKANDLIHGASVKPPSLAPEETGEDKKSIYKVCVYSLDKVGKLSKTPIENSVVLLTHRGELLLLQRFTELIPLGEGFAKPQASAFTITSAKTGRDFLRFEFEPVLSPSWDKALRVEKFYDVSNYANSFFKVSLVSFPKNYLEKNLDKVSLKEIPLYSSPYFLTLEENRWQPEAIFKDDEEVLITTFTPEKQLADSEARSVEDGEDLASLTRGTLLLEGFDVRTKRRRTILRDLSPYLRVYPLPDEPIFICILPKLGDGDKKIDIFAVSNDGKRSRLLYETKKADDVVVAGIEASLGLLLIIEHYAEKLSDYSALVELELSERPAREKKSEPVPQEKELEVPFPEESTEPPPIRLPLAPILAP